MNRPNPVPTLEDATEMQYSALPGQPMHHSDSVVLLNKKGISFSNVWENIWTSEICD